MSEKYSLKKGIGKAALQLLTVVGAIAAFAGLSDISVWSLIETHLKPMLSALTVGGIIAFGINYVKFHLS